MKNAKRLLLVFVIVCMLLCACGTANDDGAAETIFVPTEPAATDPVPTEPVVEGPVMPETDAATGTLLFYFGDYRIYAGAPMSQLIAMGIRCEKDMELELQPWHTSDVFPVRVDLEDKETDDDPLIFVVAMNTEDEPRMLSQCRIYSITVNTESGVRFGSGNETEPFVTGTTTREQIEAAYGEPGFVRSREAKYVETAYYQSFNSAYFSYKNGVVRQIRTCYSADLYGHLAENLDYDLSGVYYGADSAILMNMYMDVIPYLEGTAQVEKLESLEETIIMDGQTIQLGVRAADLPTPFGEPFQGHLMPVAHKYYVRTGRGNPEEFYMLNWNGQNSESDADDLTVKGVITENCNYRNWGKDNSAFHEFEYMGVTQDATIEEVLEAFGLPMDVRFASNGRVCEVWMSYEDVNGNELLLRVDPMLNQLVELHISKYYAGAMMHK